MNPNTEKTSLRQRLKDGKTVVGTWLQSGSAVAAGQHIVNPNETNVKRALEQGYTFLALGMDTVFIADGAKAASSYVSLAQCGNKG